MLNLSPSPCGLGGPTNPSGPCTGTYAALSHLASAFSSISASPVVAGVVGGAAILAGVGFALFCAYSVATFFGHKNDKRLVAKTPDEKAADTYARYYYKNFDMAAYGQTLSDLEADAEDDVEDDTPDDEFDSLEYKP